MTATTMLEKEIVLKIFKDFSIDYNPSTISKVLNKTRVGAFKALKELEKDTIIKGKDFGKARFYRIDLDNEYAMKNVETLLMEEAKSYQKWKDELKELFNYVKIAVIFGSFVKNPKSADDIDLLLIYDKKNNTKVNNIIKEKNEMLIKKIHPIKQTIEDFNKNLKKKDKILINAVKEGIVLYGYEQYAGLIKNVSNKQ